jgi:hypothetical protein
MNFHAQPTLLHTLNTHSAHVAGIGLGCGV